MTFFRVTGGYYLVENELNENENENENEAKIT